MAKSMNSVNLTLPSTEIWEEARAVAQRALDAGNDWVTIELHQTGEANRTADDAAADAWFGGEPY